MSRSKSPPDERSPKTFAFEKQYAHQRERHNVGQALNALDPQPDDEQMDAVEDKAKRVARTTHLRGFKN